MRIRCPQCRRYFEYQPESGPACCPHEDCGWRFEKKTGEPLNPPDPSQETAGKPDRAVDAESLPAAPGLPVRNPQQTPAAPESRELAPLPRLNTIRCPSCLSTVADTSELCPVCGENLSRSYGRMNGLRAVFDVSGDITFTPRTVVLLFLATLATFLAFTWMLTSGDSREGYSPMLLGDVSNRGSGEHNAKIQGVSFLMLKNELLNPQLTDLRRQTLVDKFRGQRVIWNGMVNKVNPGGEGGGYELNLLMEEPGSSSFASLQVLAIPTNEQRVADLQRGQRVLFSGRIAGFDTGGAATPFDYFLVNLTDGIILK